MCPILELIQRSKNVLAVTSIALSCAHICARLLQPLAQSLIGSPGTLGGGQNAGGGGGNKRMQWAQANCVGESMSDT